MQETWRRKKEFNPRASRQAQQPPGDNRQRDASHRRCHTLSIQRDRALVIGVIRIRVQPMMDGRARGQNREHQHRARQQQRTDSTQSSR